MKKTAFALGAVLALAIGTAWWWRGRAVASKPTPQAPARAVTRTAPQPAPPPAAAPEVGPKNPDYDLALRKRLLGEAKAAKLAKIARDYEEMINDVAAKFSQQGSAFPGGFNAYLKQLALLERAKWEDYAKELTPQEYENLQMHEHVSGKLVTRLLGEAPISPEQRQTVFHLQRDFDDKYALVFDMTPASLLSREIERQALQERIFATLGAQDFQYWAKGEGNDFDNLTQFAQKNGIRAEAPLEIWRIKNDFVRRRLEIMAQKTPNDAIAAQAALAEQTRNRVATLLGPAALRDAQANGLGWLPK